MIRRNTWIILVVLVIVVGAAFYLDRRKAQQQAAATPTAASGLAAEAPVFSASLGAPTDINIKDSTGKDVDVARNDSGTWVLKAPTVAPADQGAAEAAATQVTSLRVLSSVGLDLNVAGLDKPAYTMSFKFKDGSSHKLDVGAVTPIEDGYYTSLDGGPVRVVDKPGLDALIRLLTEPPYAATPTPPITLTPSAPAPTIAPSETPPPATTSTPIGATGTQPAVTDTPAATASAAATSTP